MDGTILVERLEEIEKIYKNKSELLRNRISDLQKQVNRLEKEKKEEEERQEWRI